MHLYDVEKTVIRDLWSPIDLYPGCTHLWNCVYSPRCTIYKLLIVHCLRKIERPTPLVTRFPKPLSSSLGPLRSPSQLSHSFKVPRPATLPSLRTPKDSECSKVRSTSTRPLHLVPLSVIELAILDTSGLIICPVSQEN